MAEGGADTTDSDSDDDVSLISIRASRAKKKSPAGESFVEFALLLMLKCWQFPLQRHR